MADMENQINQPLKSNQYKVLREMLHTCMILHECNTQIAYLFYGLAILKKLHLIHYAQNQ
jgi:hypothetical protein